MSSRGWWDWSVLVIAIVCTTAGLGANGYADFFPDAARLRTVQLIEGAAKQGLSLAVFLPSATTGGENFEQGLEQFFSPASTLKLLTSQFALDRLGSAFRWKTEFHWSTQAVAPAVASNLRIVGSGDPSLGDEQSGLFSSKDVLLQYAEYLRARGIRKVEGPIEITGVIPSLHRAWHIPRGWKLDDLGKCFTAIPQVIQYQRGCAYFEILALNRGRFVAGGVPVAVEMEMRPGASTNLTLRPVFQSGQPLGNGPSDRIVRYRVFGTWAQGSSPVRLNLALPDVSVWVIDRLKTALQNSGIQWSPNTTVRVANTIKTAQVPEIWTWYSPPLRELLIPFLKQSINLYGEAILQAVGIETSPGLVGNPYLLGLAEFRRWAQAKALGVAAHLVDGSGLSVLNRVRTSAFPNWLNALLAIPEYAPVLAGLPVAGVDGTLRARFTSSLLKGQLIAKTGTIALHANLVGFLTRQNRQLPFLVLVRMEREELRPLALQLQEELLTTWMGSADLF